MTARPAAVYFHIVMELPLRTLFTTFWSVLLMIGSGVPLFAQEVDDIAYRTTLEFIRSSSNKERAELFQRYGQAVERLRTKLQQQGDLENALKAREEFERTKSMEVVDVSFPGIEPLREVLERELAKIEDSEVQKLNEVHRKYLDQLQAAILELTKAGELDKAVELDAKKKEIIALIATPAPATKTDIVPPTNGGGTKLPPPPLEPSGKLDDGEVLYGELVISGGSHRLRKEVQIGRRKEVLESEKGYLSLKDGAEITGGGFFANFGRFTIDQSRLEDVAIREELQATFSGTKSIFQDCTFAKGGGWGVAWFGSKWEFTDCVFKGSFFKRWTSADVGVKIMNCTFYDVKFPAFDIRENPVAEARYKWRTIENCLFVGCEIPISMLIATTNCVFEDCRFVKDEVIENRERYKSMTVEEKVETIVYLRNSEEPSIPSPSPEYVFSFAPPPEELKTVGCPPFYTIRSNKLEFR